MAGEFDQYVKCDDNLDCFGIQTDDDIIREVQQQDLPSVDCDEDNDSDQERGQELNTPTLKETVQALDVIKNYLKAKNTYTEEIEKLEEAIYNISLSNCVQKKITNYFF